MVKLFAKRPGQDPAPLQSSLRYEPSLQAYALEPRVMLDAAAAMAALDAIAVDAPITDAHEAQTQQNTDDAIANAGALVAPPAPTGAVQDDDVVFTAAAAIAGAEGQHLIVIDPSVDHAHTLLEGRQDNTDVLVLTKDRSGLDQITEYLQSAAQDYDAIHIVSHGDNGLIYIGNDAVDNAALYAHSEGLGTWSEHLTNGGDILLYGCEVAQDGQGIAMVDTFARLTGADVAASKDDTGAPAAGGDWQFEVR
ncbi:MAG: DUF4347 domain-containing protein, partial [Pseudomonadota bacterium]